MESGQHARVHCAPRGGKSSSDRFPSRSARSEGPRHSRVASTEPLPGGRARLHGMPRGDSSEPWATSDGCGETRCCQRRTGASGAWHDIQATVRAQKLAYFAPLIGDRQVRQLCASPRRSRCACCAYDGAAIYRRLTFAPFGVGPAPWAGSSNTRLRYSLGVRASVQRRKARKNELVSAGRPASVARRRPAAGGDVCERDEPAPAGTNAGTIRG
jgi:hypothetical protein